MPTPHFRKTVIATVVNDSGPGAMNTLSAVGDINGDGRPDVVIAGRTGRMVWLQNPGADGPWAQHLVAEVQYMECGGSVRDLTGDGRADIINGGDWRDDQVYWWENPGPTGGPWPQRVLAKTGSTQFHDTLIGDVTNDGRLSLVFTNQHGDRGTAVYWVPLPADPRVSPWPGLAVVATGRAEALAAADGTQRRQPEEGLAIGDIDGDGRNELVAGTHWHRYTGQPQAPWEAHRFAQGYITTKVAIGDVDGDGRNEIVLSEGDPCIYGRTEGGKAAWFRPTGDLTALWEEHVLEEGLLDAHTLAVGPVCGTAALDIVVGEIGVAGPEDQYVTRPPRLLVFENDARGGFTRHVIDEGTGIHDGVLADTRGTGRLDIIGKPLHGPEKWNVHVYVNETGA